MKSGRSLAFVFALIITAFAIPQTASAKRHEPRPEDPAVPEPNSVIELLVGSGLALAFAASRRKITHS